MSTISENLVEKQPTLRLGQRLSSPMNADNKEVNDVMSSGIGDEVCVSEEIHEIAISDGEIEELIQKHKVCEIHEGITEEVPAKMKAMKKAVMGVADTVDEVPRKLKKMKKSLHEISDTVDDNKKMLKGIKYCLKDLKQQQRALEHSRDKDDEIIVLKEEEKKMMYSGMGCSTPAVPTVNVLPTVANGNGGNNIPPWAFGNPNQGGLFGGEGMLAGLLFGALLGGNGGLFGNRFGNGAGFDGLGGANTATVAATDFGISNLLAQLNGTIATEVGSLGVATANQTQLLSKEIGATTDTLLQANHASANQIQDKLNTNLVATLNAVSGVSSELCDVGKSILQESCANQRVTEAVGANLANMVNGNTMAIKDQINSNFIAGMQQNNAQFMSLKDCCCETQQQIANGNFALSNQMCNGFNGVERDIWSTSSAIQAQNAANTAAIQAQNCAQTNQLQRDMFTLNLGTERQMNAITKEQAECCCEQKLLTTMGFSNLQHNMDQQFCNLKSTMLEDKIEQLRFRESEARDALRDKSLADALNLTMVNGFTQLGAVFTSNVIPAIQSAIAAR